jgi:hypothetical protein
VAGSHVNSRQKLLFELDRQGFFQWLEAAAAGFRLHQPQPRPDEDACLRRKQLDVAGNRLGVSSLRLEDTIDLMPAGSPDAFLYQAGNIEEHRIF